MGLSAFFQIIYCHNSIGHGGRVRMIIAELVALYFNLCEYCQKISLQKGLVKAIISNELNSSCQADLIDMYSQDDGDSRSPNKTQSS